MTKTRIKIQWGPKEIDDLRDLVDDLRIAIENAPCEASHRGETTYECRHDMLCRVCQWRVETLKMMCEHETWRPDPTK